MIARKTRTMPKPNGIPAAILAAHGSDGEFVHANQKRPIVKATPPNIAGGKRASGGAKPPASSTTFWYRLLSKEME